MTTLLSISIDGFGSLVSTIILAATTIGSMVMWIRERKKRKFDDLHAKQDIVDMLNQKNDECMTAVLTLRNQVNNLKTEINTQQNEITKLKTENQILKERQTELIAENKKLRAELETFKKNSKKEIYSKKIPVPLKKERDTKTQNNSKNKDNIKINKSEK